MDRLHGASVSRRTNRSWLIALISASMFVIMLLAQLYSFEDFSSILSVVLPINDMPLTTSIAAGLILMQLLALPYLLGMYMSTLMRGFSALLAAAVSFFWLMMSLTNSHASNSGLFSSSLELPGGIVALVWTGILFGCILFTVFNDYRRNLAS